MPKILRVVTRLNIGGPAQQAVSLSERLASLGWETLLISGRLSPQEGTMEYLLKEGRVRHLALPSLSRSLHPLRDFAACFFLYRLLREEKPAILHTHTAKAGALGRAAGLLYRMAGSRLVMVHTFHGHVLTGYFGRLRSFFFRMIERILARVSDRVIAVSPEGGEDLVRLGVAPREKIRVIPVGFSLDRLIDLPQREEKEGRFIVGLVGRFVPIKNHLMLLEAVGLLSARALLNGTQFLLAGDGELREALQAHVRRLEIGQSVRFLGWQSDRPSLYHSVDAVCLTSRNEGTPAALIEAMAAARPVIATDVGGVRGLLQGDASSSCAISPGSFEIRPHGLLVRTEDPEGLAKALSYLMAHPEEGRQMGRAGRAFVRERFSLERLVRDHHRLYQELLSG